MATSATRILINQAIDETIKDMNQDLDTTILECNKLRDRIFELETVTAKQGELLLVALARITVLENNQPQQIPTLTVTYNK